MNQIFNKLEELRNDKKFSQQEFANIVGRTREWYANILRTKNMRVDDLNKFRRVASDTFKERFSGY